MILNLQHQQTVLISVSCTLGKPIFTNCLTRYLHIAVCDNCSSCVIHYYSQFIPNIQYWFQEACINNHSTWKLWETVVGRYTCWQNCYCIQPVHASLQYNLMHWNYNFIMYMCLPQKICLLGLFKRIHEAMTIPSKSLVTILVIFPGIQCYIISAFALV